MADIVIAEFMDEAAIRDGLAGRDVVYDPKLVARPDELSRLVVDARALIVRNRTQVRGALLDAAKALKVVGRLGVGLDNIDVAACEARGVKVFPASGANDVSVAEYVICAALLLLRDAFHATPRMVAGEWPREALIGREISGKVIGLVGFGAIAREVAKRAKAFGAHVMAFDPYAPDAAFAAAGVHRHGLEPLLREADVISLHVPLDDGTRAMIDALRLQRMKQGAILINAARGGVVDDAAVAAALKTGHLGGAALDVFETEPLGADCGRIFAGVPNLILTPHIAGVTEESNVRVSWVTVENVKKVLDA